MLSASQLAALPHFKDYDLLFPIYADKWLPGFDWLRLKAQAVQESKLEPEAVSPRGAVGLMQLMPATDKWIDNRINARDPVAAIDNGARYMAYLMGRPVPGLGAYRGFVKAAGDDLWLLALAAYNAGQGNIQKAMVEAAKRKLDPRTWQDVRTCLPAITGKHADETLEYVVNIQGYYSMLQRIQGG